MILVAALGWLPPQPAAGGGAAQLERRVGEHINEIRQAHGLEPLQSDPKLNRIARAYSRAMAVQNFFSHTAPDGSDVGDRVRDTGLCYRAVGENLAKNYNVSRPAEVAISGWMGSEEHRKNILTAEFRKTGVGVWRDGRTYYFTQIFFRAFPSDLACPPRSAAFKPSAAR